MRIEALGQSCPALAALAGIRLDEDTKVLLAPLPADLAALADHPLVREKLMPVLGIVRSPSVEHAIDACALVTEHGGLGHTSAVYADDPEIVERFGDAIRTGRILVNAPTAVGALGGVYNELAPTFSLGCGTWGGSTTTANVNYRELLNVKVVSRRQSPPQWFRVPPATFFNTGALGALREAAAAAGAARDRRRHGGAGRARRAAAPAGAGRRARVLGRRARAGGGGDPRRRRAPGGDGRRPRRGRGRRLGDRRRQGHAPALRASRADRGRARAAVPGPAQADRALPAGTAPRPADRRAHHRRHRLRGLAGRRADGRRREAHARRLLAGPRPGGRRAAPDRHDAAHAHRGHRRRRADARARGLRVDLRVAVLRRALPAGGPDDPRRAAARLRGRGRPRRADADGQRRDDRGTRLRQRVRRRQPRARPRGRRAVRRRARAGQRALPPARAPLQRGDPDEVHAGARLRRLRRPGQVRRDGARARARPVMRRALREGRRAARRRSACRGPRRPPGSTPAPTGPPCPSSRWRRSPTSACAPTRACRWSPSCAPCSSAI